MRIQVKDFMSTPVTTGTGETSVEEIRTLMSRKNIHSIPIIQYVKQLPEAEVTIRGIITATDIGKETDDKALAVDVMTASVHVIHQDSSARAAAKMMLKHKCHHLVVMDNGKVIGMVSSLDFVKLVAQYTLAE